MRLPILALLLAGSALLAQRPNTSPTGFGRMSNPSGVTPAPGGAGFGRMIYPGTGGPPAVRRPGTGFANGAVRLGVPPAATHPANHQRTVLVPYPVFYGGGYYGYDAPPAPTPVNEYDPGFYDPNYGPSPVVIINQNFRPDTANPVIHDYSNVPLPPAYVPQAPDPAAAPNDAAQILFLIAMKDHTIYPAVAYWVENDILNYITPQGARNRISLDLVDRDFSKQLNDERRVEFALPAPQ